MDQILQEIMEEELQHSAGNLILMYGVAYYTSPIGNCGMFEVKIFEKYFVPKSKKLNRFVSKLEVTSQLTGV